MKIMTLLGLLLILTACAMPGQANVASGAAMSEADPDALVLRKMAAQAERLAAREAEAVVLRQVDTNLVSFTFRFTDSRGELEIDVIVPELTSPVDNWKVQTVELSPLLGHPVERTVDLLAVRVGPYRVANALWDQWPGCTIRSLTLHPSTEGGLTWGGFCNTPDGVVNGVMNNRTGEFRPSRAPAAPLPSTATPIPQPTIDPAFASSVPLFLRNEEEQRYEIRLVDPMTGQSVAGYAPIALGPQIPTAYGLSADGKKLAVIDSRGKSCEYYAGGTACRPSGDVLHLVDLPALREGSAPGESLSAIQVRREVTVTLSGKGWVELLAFSPDASRLALVENTRESSRLMVYDTGTGELVARLEPDFRPSLLTYTQNGMTLVVYGQPLGVPPGMGRPGPPRVLLLDATSLGRLWDRPLETVLSGEWCLEKCSEPHGAQVFAEWRPAVVPSHDGRRLYIVHADVERLMTVDFDALTVRSVILREAQSWLDRLLDLTAGVAEAKGIWTGTAKAAVLSPDGKRLYVVGRTTTVARDVDSEQDAMETHLSLQVIDLASGRKMMRRDIEVTGTWISADRVQFTADGAHVLVSGWKDGEGWTGVLDAKSLERVAHLPGWEVALARRMDGQPILLARRWPRERRGFEFAVLDPRSFEVVDSWGQADAWWVTMS